MREVHSLIIDARWLSGPAPCTLSWPTFASRCRSVASCGFWSATAYDFRPVSVAAIPANPAAESLHQARVRVTNTQVDTSDAML
jgi:hypothetical protein